MEGFPLALAAENTPMLELLVGGNLECINNGQKIYLNYFFSNSSRLYFALMQFFLSLNLGIWKKFETEPFTRHSWRWGVFGTTPSCMYSGAVCLLFAIQYRTLKTALASTLCILHWSGCGTTARIYDALWSQNYHISTVQVYTMYTKYIKNKLVLTFTVTSVFVYIRLKSKKLFL